MLSSLSRGLCALCASLSLPAAARAADVQDVGEPDLAGLSIEELAQVQVTTASKRVEPLSSAPAALYVITGHDLEAAGVFSLPEALRLAPNLQVQQFDSNQYSISARGFNGVQASNKLLALIDGRTIYTPLGSSVLWNLHSPLLEDLKQIEVVSGPGGTLYGPNAVNGVVNVVTRDAQETLGTLVRGTVGSEERSAAVRHGFALSSSGAMRVYANWLGRKGLPPRLAAESDDDYRGWQSGFRTDFVTDTDHFTLQGDIFRTRSDLLSGDGAKGHNLLARWSKTLSAASSFQLQAYYDHFERRFTLVDDSLQTLDAEGQFNFSAGAHDLVAGAGVRTTRDEFVNQLNLFNLNPPRRRLWVYNAFVQDQFRVTPELSVIAGVKVERSTFTGWQVLPNIRLAWQPNSRHLVWGAVSRAVRTPSRIDRQLEAPPFLVASPDFRSEKLIALEIGYRGQPTSATTLTVNGFVNRYDDLRSTEFVDGSFQLRNGGRGTTYGVEAWGSAQLLENWRVFVGATTLWKNLRDKEGHQDLIPRNSRGNDPRWRLTARSEHDLTDRLKLTINARAVGRIEQDPEIGSYVEAGGQLSYRLDPAVELFVAGRNLLHEDHAESNDPNASLATRSIYAGARATF